MSTFSPNSSALHPGADLFLGRLRLPIVTHNGSLTRMQKSVGMAVIPALIGTGAELAGRGAYLIASEGKVCRETTASFSKRLCLMLLRLMRLQYDRRVNLDE